MPPASPDQKALAKRARLAALIMAAAMILWMGAQAVGGRMGWDVRLAFAFDIAAIAALLWAMWIVWTIYRTRRAGRD